VITSLSSASIGLAPSLLAVDFSRLGEKVPATGADTCVAGSAVFGAPDADGGCRQVLCELRLLAAPRPAINTENLKEAPCL
jgi:pentose-5-phosphate-3-epimerase